MIGRCAALAGVLTACGAARVEADADAGEVQWLSVPEDFPELPQPEGNRLTQERVALGRKLFYDRRLSRDEQVACADCHLQAHGFADTHALSSGVDGSLGNRNAPTLANLAYLPRLLWDGGVPSLELQAIVPIRSPVEMDTTLGATCERLSQSPEMVAAFEAAYARSCDEFTLTSALASFERTLTSGNSPWDRFRRGEQDALGAEARRGLSLFERLECASCHAGVLLTNGEFRNNGARPEEPDSGRAHLTLAAGDVGKFKVPTLRNVALTAPYFHDGSLPTLDAVIDHYANGGLGSPNTDPQIVGFSLDASDRAALRAFLEALTDDEFTRTERFGPDR